MTKTVCANIVFFGCLALFPHALHAQAVDPELVDKTLVVWVAPANLAQRGGSALTIEDAGDHFDGVVFSELAAGKWMAGSDMSRQL